MSPMSSTMISSVSTRLTEVNEADQTQKISHLEDELNRLRQQMAMLVEAQEHVNKSHGRKLFAILKLIKSSQFKLSFFHQLPV